MVVTVLRWIVGGIAGAARGRRAVRTSRSTSPSRTSLRCERARRLRAWIRLLALAWFNVEVWGRVVYTHRHWT